MSEKDGRREDGLASRPLFVMRTVQRVVFVLETMRYASQSGVRGYFFRAIPQYINIIIIN